MPDERTDVYILDKQNVRGPGTKAETWRLLGPCNDLPLHVSSTIINRSGNVGQVGRGQNWDESNHSHAFSFG